MLTRSVVTRLARQAVTTSRALSTASDSPWANYDMAPLDPIIGLNEAFQQDDYPQKVIVGVGAYRDDQGKPYVLPCVREAEQRLVQANLVSTTTTSTVLYCTATGLLPSYGNAILLHF